jgi:hypothetical protein
MHELNQDVVDLMEIVEIQKNRRTVSHHAVNHFRFTPSSKHILLRRHHHHHHRACSSAKNFMFLFSFQFLCESVGFLPAKTISKAWTDGTHE